jgi:hypothetical protein
MESDDDMPELEEILLLPFHALFLFENYEAEEDFWEPVKVCLSTKQIQMFGTQMEEYECPICTETVKKTRLVPCCKQNMCQKCTVKWFKSSVKCPFCVRDARDYY